MELRCVLNEGVHDQRQRRAVGLDRGNRQKKVAKQRQRDAHGTDQQIFPGRFDEEQPAPEPVCPNEKRDEACHRRNKQQREQRHGQSFRSASRSVSMWSNCRLMWKIVIPITKTATKTSSSTPSSTSIGVFC